MWMYSERKLKKDGNVNGNYEPSNCKWITPIEQYENKRNNIMITYCGETHTCRKWSTILGLKYNKTRWRIVHGWPIEKAFDYKKLPEIPKDK